MIWKVEKEGGEPPRCIKTCVGHTDRIKCVAISKTDEFFVSSGRDKIIRMWSFPEGNLLKTFIGHSNCVRSICVSNNCNFIISSSQDQTVRIWNIEEGNCNQNIFFFFL